LFGDEGGGPIAPLGRQKYQFSRTFGAGSILVKQGAEMFGFDLLLLGGFGDINGVQTIASPGFFGGIR
jgi:hypothetical protein